MKKFCFLFFFIMLSMFAFLAEIFPSANVPLTNAEEAETYTLNNFSIELTYGDQVNSSKIYSLQSEIGVYFKVAKFRGATTKTGIEADLTTDGRVSALIVSENYRYYYMTISPDDGKLIPCDENGNRCTNFNFTGTVRFKVKKKPLSIVVEENDLVKEYGDNITSLDWAYKNPAETDSSLNISLTCSGFTAKAPVGEYPVNVASVTKSNIDVSTCYDIRIFKKNSENIAKFNVNKKSITFTYDKQEVKFNDFLIENGNVCKMEQDGVNGDIITAYFKLVGETPNFLVMGQEYEIALAEYRVNDDLYTLSDNSYYDINAVNKNGGTMKVYADKGDITIYTDSAKQAERAGNYKYAYFNENDFTYSYLDDEITSYSGENIHLKTLRVCGMDVSFFVTNASWMQNENIKVGTYSLTAVGSNQSAFDSVTFENVNLVVKQRVIATFNHQIEIEYAMYEETYEMPFSVTYNGNEYNFILSANVEDKVVGNEVDFNSAECTENSGFALDFSDASITIIKRSTGVSLEVKQLSAIYGEEPTVCEVYLNKGKANEKVLSETISYKYKADGGTNEMSGMPTDTGKYTITCTLESNNYAVAKSRTVAFNILARPICAVYNVVKASKVYGEEFKFSNKNAMLSTIYFYDKNANAENREVAGLVYGDNTSAIGGSGLSSLGVNKSANAGAYDIDFSGLYSENYEICKVILFDQTANAETSKFTVEKAEKPPIPKINVSGNGLKMTITLAEGVSGFDCEISTTADMESVEKLSSATNSVEYKKCTFGTTYYIRARINNSTNFRTAKGEYCTAVPFEIIYPKITVKEYITTQSSVSFEPNELAGVSNWYVEYKLANGEWTKGKEITKLIPNREYSIKIRAASDSVKGDENTFKFTTMRASPKEELLSVVYDRTTEEITFAELEDVEYRLLNSEGEVIVDWQNGPLFSDVLRNSVYYVECRFVETENGKASDVTRIKINTSPDENYNFIQEILSDYFMAFVCGGTLIVLIIMIVVFAKVKKGVDKNELRDKYDK